MSLIIAAILIMVVVIIYLLLIDLFTILLRVTGLTQEKARFQAISLLTTCGFTTKESEVISGNPARRKIAIAAMLTGYSFSVIIVSLLINLINSISTDQATESFGFVLLAFIVFIFLIVLLKLPAVAKKIEGGMSRLTEFFLRRNKKDNSITQMDDYGKNCICQVDINIVPTCLKDKTLLESGIRDKFSLTILDVRRKNKNLDVTPQLICEKGDIVTVFGTNHNIRACFTVNPNEVKVETKIDTSNENIVTIIDNFDRYVIATVQIRSLPAYLTNRELRFSGLKETREVNILLITREGHNERVKKDTKLSIGDNLVVFGAIEAVNNAFLMSLNQ